MPHTTNFFISSRYRPYIIKGSPMDETLQLSRLIPFHMSDKQLAQDLDSELDDSSSSTTRSIDLQEEYDLIPISMLWLQILEQMVNTAIKDRQFNAVSQICLFNRYFLRRTFHLYFPNIRPSLISDTEKYCRISRTFLIMSTIYDEVLLAENLSNDRYFINTLTYNQPFYSPAEAFAPWNFVSIDRFYNPRNKITLSRVCCNIDLCGITQPLISGEDTTGWTNFVTGDKIGDIVWVKGQYNSNNEIFHASEYYQPVIILRLVDIAAEVISTRHILNNSIEMQNFTRLLKHAFGPRTGVFFSLSVDDVRDELEIEEIEIDCDVIHQL